MLGEDELKDAKLLVFANKQVGPLHLGRGRKETADRGWTDRINRTL